MIALYSFFFNQQNSLGCYFFGAPCLLYTTQTQVRYGYPTEICLSVRRTMFISNCWTETLNKSAIFFHHLVAAWIWFSVAKYRGIVSASFWALNTVGCIWNSRSFRPISTWQYLGCNANSCYGIPMWSYNNLSNHVAADNLEWPSFQYWTPFLTQYLEKCQLQRSDVMHALFRRLYLNWRTIQGH